LVEKKKEEDRDYWFNHLRPMTKPKQMWQEKWLAKEEGCSSGDSSGKDASKVTPAREEDNPELGDGNPELGNCHSDSSNSNQGKENDRQGGLYRTRGARSRKKENVMLHAKGQLHGGAQGVLPRHKNTDCKRCVKESWPRKKKRKSGTIGLTIYGP
jgi:hypothetical protein